MTSRGRVSSRLSALLSGCGAMILVRSPGYRTGSDAAIQSARSTWRRLMSHIAARFRQAATYGSQSANRNPDGPAGIKPSARTAFSALVSAMVYIVGRQAASTTLLMAGPKR